MAKCFIDTMGFYSILDRRVAHHDTANAWLETASRKRIHLYTSDYVLDETATLIKRRGLAHVLRRFFGLLEQTQALQLIPIDMERFARTRQFFLKQLDQDYSFTDCSSFVVMQEFKIRNALTHDNHFEQAGFRVLL